MRILVKDTNLNITFKVYAWTIALGNSWEFYFGPDILNALNDNIFSLVYGHEVEMGYVALSELKPHIYNIVKGQGLYSILAPPHWHWA